MRPIATDVACYVCLRACLSVGHKRELYKNWLTPRWELGYGLDSGEPKNHVLGGGPDPAEEGQFGGGISGRLRRINNIRRAVDILNLTR